MRNRSRQFTACSLLLCSLGTLGCDDAASAPVDAGAVSPVTGSPAVPGLPGSPPGSGSAFPDASIGISPGTGVGSLPSPVDGGTIIASDGGPGPSSGGGSGGGAGGSPVTNTGTGSLPAVSDVKAAGPFTPTRGQGPNGYVLVHPKELGRDGVKHPIVSWGPGAVENAGSFTTLLNHLASHGFVVLSFDATPQGEELTKGIDWLVAENGRSGSPLYQKLDVAKVAAGGHSAGSIATFKIAKDPRLVTTMHISGGTFDPHTDIANLHAPTLFICGEPAVDGLLVGDVARANCDIDFTNSKVPTFYGIPKGASHMTPTEVGDAALRTLELGAMTAWLRYQIAGDSSQAAKFVGPSCELCRDAAWTVKQKGL